MAKTASPCPPGGPAHDGRGGGRGVPGGTRQGISSPPGQPAAPALAAQIQKGSG